MPRNLFFWCLLSLLIFTSCRRTSDSASDAVNRVANKEEKLRIEQAQILHDSGDIEAALSSLRSWVDTTIYRVSHDIAYELIITWLLELNRNADAKRLAAFFLQRHPKSESANRIIKLFEEKPPIQNLEEPKKEEPATEPEPELDPFFESTEENAEEQTNELLDLENGVPLSEEKIIKKDQLADYVLYTAPMSEIEKLASSPNNSGFGYSVVRLAEYYLHLGQPEESFKVLSRVKKKLPDMQNELVLAMKQEIDDILQVNTKNIGILLPLTGSYGVYGKKTLAAISMALNVPLNFVGEISSFEKDGVNFFIADSKSDPLAASTRVNQLVKIHHVAIIIGEITNDISLISAQICQRYGVPMLNLARHPLIAEVGDQIFTFNSSPSQQIASLVDHAVKKLHHKRFAILFGRHNYGMSMSKLFFDEVLKQGGSITALEAYDANDTTFTTPAKKLVGKYYLKERPEYAHCQELTERKAIDECKQAVVPIVEFDALFIPEFEKLALIIPALVQEDLLVTNDAKAKNAMSLATNRENIPYVRLLGASSWNNKTMLVKVAPHINGAYFVDSMSFENSDELKKFSDNFFNVNASLPTTLEVFAYDATLLALTLLSSQENNTGFSNRKEIRDRILSTDKKVGLLDKIAFLKNRELDAKEIGFEIVNGSVRRADYSNNS